MSTYHPHERPERERPSPTPRHIPAPRAHESEHDTPPATSPVYEAGSQFAGIIHRQVAAERAARRTAAGEPEPPPPLATNMPAQLRHGPGSQTAAAFYREAAERQRTREAAGRVSPHHDGKGEVHDHDAHAARHAPVEHHALAHPTHRPVVHHAHTAVPQAASHQATAALAHGVDPELLAAVLAGPGAPLDVPLQEAVERHLGVDLGAVRVHTGPEADLLSEQAGRMAFTVGESLIFGQGAYRPATPEGQRLLADGLAAVLEHAHGAPRHLPRATTGTGGGGGGGFGFHGEGVGAVRPLAAASLFAGTGAATGAHAATAAQFLPLIHQVYARPRHPVRPVHSEQGGGALPLASATLGSGAPVHMRPKDPIGPTGPDSGTAPGSSAQGQQNIRDEYVLINDLAKVVGRNRIYNANDPAGLQKAHDHHGCDAAMWVHTKYAELDLVIPFISDAEYAITREVPTIVGDRGTATWKPWATSQQDAINALHGIARGFGLDALFYQERQVFANIGASLLNKRSDHCGWRA